MKGRVLVAGFATRHVVCSAYKAGYEVYAIDCFCDQDLHWYTKSCRTFEEMDEMPDIISEEAGRRKFDYFVVTSGAEDISSDIQVWGTDRKCAEKFISKRKIQDFFEENSVPVPPISPEGKYPAMLKPVKGAGGWRNMIVSNKSEEDEWNSLWPDVPYIRQDVIDGIPCSVSCIASKSGARAVSVNLQTLRGGAGERAFGFSGAVTPFNTGYADELKRTAEFIAEKSGCIGSLGVDFILSDGGAYAIEVNPRFQATLDIVEGSTGLNIFEAHINAFKGELPPAVPHAPHVYARRIIFADRDLVVKDDLKKFHPNVADIPWPGTEIEVGSAIISVYGSGKTEEEADSSLHKNILEINGYIDRW